jgi:hypothetical protein
MQHDAPSHQRRPRRQSRFSQAEIARTVRVAREHAGPNWRVEVEVEGTIIRMYQGDPPITQAPAAPDNGFARGLEIVP